MVKQDTPLHNIFIPSMGYSLSFDQATSNVGKSYHNIPLTSFYVFMQVCYNGSKSPVFFVANRGHHADIGGKTPGI